MPQKEFFLTPGGLTKLRAELDHLRNVERQEVANKLLRAKEVGGTVNNAEYDDAKNEQAFIEGRILTLEQMIKNATLIQAEGSSCKQVNLGCKVTVRNQDGKSENYTIVGSAEADPSEGRISNASPVGRALMGKKVGEKVQVVVPAGVLRLSVVDIG